eukprot:8788645-Pyramimonas_sp.AAC.1
MVRSRVPRPDGDQDSGFRQGLRRRPGSFLQRVDEICEGNGRAPQVVPPVHPGSALHRDEKSPVMAMAITMCDNSNDEHGKGMRCHERRARADGPGPP